MNECTSCGRQHRPATLFCPECGAYLPTGGPLRTEPLPDSDLLASRANPWALDGGEAKDVHNQTKLRFIVKPSGRRVRLLVASVLVLGRLDATYGIYPDLDLTPDDLDAGVSRRHARIHRKDKRLLVEDVDSTNGTFLNGRRLTPFLSYPLRTGDELQLGGVRMQVEFDAER